VSTVRASRSNPPETNVSLRSLSSRVRVALALVVLAVLVMAAAFAMSDSLKEPDKLIILSTTDVKGKTSPCG
jgi:uncharacterized protein YoxC